MVRADSWRVCVRVSQSGDTRARPLAPQGEGSSGHISQQERKFRRNFASVSRNANFVSNLAKCVAAPNQDSA